MKNDAKIEWNFKSFLQTKMKDHSMCLSRATNEVRKVQNFWWEVHQPFISYTKCFWPFWVCSFATEPMVTSTQPDYRFLILLNLCIFFQITFFKHLILIRSWYFMIFSLFFSLPWNQQSLIGCIASRLYALLFGQSYVVLNGVTGSYFVSIVHHHNAFYQHYTALCEQINEISVMENNGPQAKYTIIKLIKFHTAAKGFDKFIHTKSYIF